MNEEYFELTSENVKHICDRKRGVGADGVLVMIPSDKANFRMRIFNTDGSEGEMCGKLIYVKLNVWMLLKNIKLYN